MTELTEILRQDGPVTPEQADLMTTSWPGLLTSQIATVESCRAIEEAAKQLSEPAQPSWIMARIAALLSQYYAADVPAAAVSMMAEDWLEELRPYPQWAITKAVRWWKSNENDDRRKKPLEGDISARARMEMGVVAVANSAVTRFHTYGPTSVEPSPPPEMSAEEREESRKRIDAYVQQAGYASRRANPTNSEGENHE